MLVTRHMPALMRTHLLQVNFVVMNKVGGMLQRVDYVRKVRLSLGVILHTSFQRHALRTVRDFVLSTSQSLSHAGMYCSTPSRSCAF